MKNAHASESGTRVISLEGRALRLVFIETSSTNDTVLTWSKRHEHAALLDSSLSRDGVPHGEVTVEHVASDLLLSLEGARSVLNLLMGQTSSPLAAGNEEVTLFLTRNVQGGNGVVSVLGQLIAEYQAAGRHVRGIFFLPEAWAVHVADLRSFLIVTTKERFTTALETELAELKSITAWLAQQQASASP